MYIENQYYQKDEVDNMPSLYLYIYSFFIAIYHLFIQLYAWISTRRNKKIEKEVKRRLSEWKIALFAENSYLFRIPSERVEKKRQEILRELKGQV
jgi:hypothetical protein